MTPTELEPRSARKTAPVARPAAGPGTTRECPLSAEDLRQLHLARARGVKIRRTIRVARFNGWTIGSFAALSLPLGLTSLTTLLLGVAFAVVAYNEFAGAKLLEQLDPRAPRRLGFNQLGLAGVLIAYGFWGIWSGLSGPAMAGAELASNVQINTLLGPIEDLRTTITLAVYGSLIVGSVIFQGGTAWYYFSRAHYIRDYSEQTPGWIVDLRRLGELA